MQDIQRNSIWSEFSNIFTNLQADINTKKPAMNMRPLNDEELRAVAGGPECEVGSGA